MDHSQSDLVVGVDLATAEARATSADATGRVHAEAAVPLPPPEHPRPGWSEQDAGAWWPAVVQVLSALCDDLGEGARRIAAVSVAATSGTVVLADADGEPLSAALMYDDQRAKGEAAAAQDAGADRWDSLGLRVSRSFGLPKWAWLLSQPEARERARFAWHASDLVVSRLIGEPAPTDWSHALKSGYDPLRQEWATEVLEAVGIPPALVPDVLPPGAHAGTLSAEAAEHTGLPAGCSVRLGMTDGCAGQVAAGAERPGRFVGILGTTFVVKGASEDLVRDPGGSVYSHRHPEGWWLPGGASNTGGAALREWFPDRDLADLDERAARFGPAGCLVYPLTGTGERFPFLVPEAEGFWVGSPGDEVERYRATLEGVAFLERLSYERLASVGAPAEAPVAAGGGGSRSRVWLGVRATVLGGPLAVPSTPHTAFGACVLAATETLHPTLSEAARAMVSVREEVEPVDAERDRLEEGYARFVAALRERGWVGDDVGP